MAGISGMDEFTKGLGAFVDNIGKLDGLTVSVEPTDTLFTVEENVRIEARRRGMSGLSATEVRSIAQDMLSRARSQR